MKRLSPFLFSLLLSSFAYAGNDDEKVKSSITDVTVYMSGAQITQKASYSVKVGITKIIIENISPTIDKNSLQVNASGNVVIVDAKYSIFYPKPEEVSLEGLPLKIRKEIKSLEDSLYHLNFDLQQIQDEIDLYIATKNILANNGSMRGQGKVNDSINLLKQAVDYYLIKVNELNKKIIVLNKQKSDKNILKKEISERLLKLHNYREYEHY